MIISVCNEILWTIIIDTRNKSDSFSFIPFCGVFFYKDIIKRLKTLIWPTISPPTLQVVSGVKRKTERDKKEREN